MQYRWATRAIAGPWFSRRDDALRNALMMGQASLSSGEGIAIELHPFTSIEERADSGEEDWPAEQSG